MAKGTKSETRKKPKMVDWFSPGQLTQTGLSVVSSTLLGASLDNRRIIALGGSREDSVIDYSAEESFTFDYIADTGDGWDSTYTMAYLLTIPSISPDGADGPLERADIAIIGGDAVYPVSSKEVYQDRLIWPFEQAPDDIRKNPDTKRLPRKDIFIVPGNHDWYDSLGSMTSRFFAYRDGEVLKERELGQFNTRQVRSYFVLKLPQNWEVWAVDIQLGKDIDTEQYAFFADHAKSLAPDTKVVLCTAEPTIVSSTDLEHDKADLIFGLKRITGLAYNNRAKVRVQLAGDTHNYQRYSVEHDTKDDEVYERHHFVCGGGGAFLHPTHAFNKGSIDNPRMEALARYPDSKTSRRLTWGNLGFAFKHKSMSLFLGLLYAMLFWTTGLISASNYVLYHPGSAVLMAVMVVGFTVFAKTKKWWGLVHGLAHAGLAIGIWALAEELAWDPIPGLSETSHIRVFVFVLGSVLAGTLFGIYLLASLNVMRIHHNEAFSSLGSPHYKCFMRCTIEDDASLTIRTIGVPKTAGSEGSHPVPTMLIEKIHIPA